PPGFRTLSLHDALPISGSASDSSITPVTLRQGASCCNRVGSYTWFHSEASHPPEAFCDDPALPALGLFPTFDFSPEHAQEKERRISDTTRVAGPRCCMALSDGGYRILVHQRLSAELACWTSARQ